MDEITTIQFPVEPDIARRIRTPFGAAPWVG